MNRREFLKQSLTASSLLLVGRTNLEAVKLFASEPSENQSLPQWLLETGKDSLPPELLAQIIDQIK